MTRKTTIRHSGGETPVLTGPGLLGALGGHLAAHTAVKRAAVISDENAASLYLNTVKSSLEKAGIAVGAAVVLKPGEGSKTLRTVEKTLDALLSEGLSREDGVIALGGGVVGDIAGLAASLLNRGVNLIHAPTTLLAQVDSAIGGKNGVNTAHGKNLIGTFYQPKLIAADTDTLKTLPKAEFCAGYAEMVKHAILGGEEAFAHLENNFEAFFAREPKTLEAGVFESLCVKARIVEADERERGQRMQLNLGHTFAHGLETLSGYQGLRHGEAVALGLVLALKFAPAKDGLIRRVTAHLERAGLPTTFKAAGLTPGRAELIAAMEADKKRGAGGLRLVVPHDLGDVRIHEGVSADKLDGFLKNVGL